MRNFENHIFGLILAFCLCSCFHTSNVGKVLDRAEMYLTTAPDSAFVALDSLDRSLLNTKGLQARHALFYSQALEMVGTFIIRLDGSPGYASAVGIVPGTLNVLLDWLFVFPLGMGIKGSSLATTICCGISAIMVVVYMARFTKTLHWYSLKFSRTSLWLTARNLGYMVRSGFSSLLGELAMSMVMLIGNYVFIRSIGEDGVAAFSVACYLYPIVFMVNNSVAQSAQPIISYNYGAGLSDRVHEALRMSVRTALICGGLAMAVLILGSKPLIGLFLKAGTNPYNIAVAGIPLFATSAVFFALNISLIGYYQAIERNGRATIYMLLRGLVLLLPSFVLLPKLIFPQGMWLAVPVSEALTLMIILLLWKRVCVSSSFFH